MSTLIVTVRRASGEQTWKWAAALKSDKELRDAVLLDAHWKGYEVVKIVRATDSEEIEIPLE